MFAQFRRRIFRERNPEREREWKGEGWTERVSEREREKRRDQVVERIVDSLD